MKVDMNRMKRWGINTGLLCLSLSISLFITEFILRAIEYKSPPHFATAYRYYFKPDPESGYDIQENFPKTKAHIEGNSFYEFWSNDLGCFDTPFSGREDYILLLGDSFTHMFAPFEDKWGTILQDLLNFRVLKCGVAGYGTRQEYLKAQKIVSRVKIPPKLIVIGYFTNDLGEDYLFPKMAVVKGFLAKAQKVDDIKSGVVSKKDALTLEKEMEEYQKKLNDKNSFLKTITNWLSNNSIVYTKVKILLQKIPFMSRVSTRVQNQAVASPQVPPVPAGVFTYGFSVLPEGEYPWVKKAWDIHFENFKAFKRFANTIGAKLLVVIIPAKDEIYFPQVLRDNGIDLATPHKKIHEFLEKENIPCLDLLPLFSRYANQRQRNVLDPEKDLYWRKDSHWSIKGNHLAGLLVAQYILENNIIRLPDKDMELKAIRERLETLKQTP